MPGYVKKLLGLPCWPGILCLNFRSGKKIKTRNIDEQSAFFWAFHSCFGQLSLKSQASIQSENLPHSLFLFWGGLTAYRFAQVKKVKWTLWPRVLTCTPGRVESQNQKREENNLFLERSRAIYYVGKGIYPSKASFLSTPNLRKKTKKKKTFLELFEKAPCGRIAHFKSNAHWSSTWQHKPRSALIIRQAFQHQRSQSHLQLAFA